MPLSTTRAIMALTIALTLCVSVAPQANAQSNARNNGQNEEDDRVFKPAEPDFTLIGLPTSLSLPKFKSAVRITHRFTQELGSDNFAANFFGIDSGAQIGLEFRFGIVPHGEIGIHRTSNRTIELFAQYTVTNQGTRIPVEVAALASIEGTNNFKDDYNKQGLLVEQSHRSPAVGVIVTRLVGAYAAVYVEPIYVNNSNPLPKQLVDHNNTFMLGLGTRVRIRPSVYLVAEASPRLAGYKPGTNHASFAIEKRAGGHMFQLNFSNSLATTMGQIAHGGLPVRSGERPNWYMGFNISRKFY